MSGYGWYRPNRNFIPHTELEQVVFLCSSRAIILWSTTPDVLRKGLRGDSVDRIADLSTGKVSYRMYQGPASDCVVVMTALGSCSAEWWHLAERWSKERPTLLYDRGGYGLSEPGERARTPDTIARELKALLDALHISCIRLFGHSIGGLYAYRFALVNPDTVRSIILLDPVFPDSDRLREEISEEEYKRSGIEKEGNVKILKALTSLGLGFLLKPLLKKAPPFRYYSGFTTEAEKRILSNAVQRKTILTVENEYSWIKDRPMMRQIRIVPGSLRAPITMILHTPDVLIREMETVGKVPRGTGEKVERIWSDLMREYLVTSEDSREVQARNSAHFIHLSDPECLEEALSDSFPGG